MMVQKKWLLWFVAAALLFNGCAAEPRVIPIPAPPETAVRSVDWLDENYPQLLVAIVSVMVREMNFPLINGIVTIYPNYQTFEAGLAIQFEANMRRSEERTGKRQPDAVRQENIESAARQRAATATAVAIGNNVVVNAIAFRRYKWSERVRVLAHELTHVLQYDLSDHRPAGWEHWMIEGFADWTAYKVLDQLGIENFSKSRQDIIDTIIAGHARNALPSLSQLYSTADIITWTRTLGRYAAYGQGMIATDLLIKEKGLQSVLDYFRKFAKINNRQRNFNEAFRETLAQFDARFTQHLAVMGRE